ncbi:MAG: hypothetical protein AAB769_00645 [Patescibacteria group bacterium]
MRKHPFLNNHTYHIFNRGVEKRDIFLDENDYRYFVHDLFVLNDSEPFLNNKRTFAEKPGGIDRPRVPIIRDPLVDLFVFNLMPNHFHLEARQKVDGGITKFMRKLGTSYTMFFNKKYDRVGPLLQGTFKAVLLEKDPHFMYLPHYIHFNPLDLMPRHNDRGSTSIIVAEEKMKFLSEYKWSSFQDYIGKNNFPSVTEREFLLNFFGGVEGYKKAVLQWLGANEENGGKITGMGNDLLIDLEN